MNPSRLEEYLKYAHIKTYAGNVASAGAGLTYVTPNLAGYNQLALIWHAYGYHTAGADREAAWYYATDAGTVLLWGTYTLATTLALSLHSSPEGAGMRLEGLIPATLNAYPRFGITAVGAGENLYIKVFYYLLPVGYAMSDV